VLPKLHALHYAKSPCLLGFKGSGLRPALVRRDVSMKLFSYFMELGFHHHILTYLVWARGLKVSPHRLKGFIVASGVLISVTSVF